MKKITIAICEVHDTYRERLAEYFIQKKGEQIQVFTFSSKAIFTKKKGDKPFDIILWGSEFGKVLHKEETDSLCIFLSETPDWPKEREPAVFKYQSAEEILRSIYERYVQMGKTNLYISQRKKEIIGVYSPTRSRMQTPFAITLAQILSEEKRCLYVNFGEWAGFGSWFQEDFRRDLADLLYLLSNYGSQVQGILECVIHSMNKVDYIPPMTDAQLLCETEAEDYMGLLQLLTEKTDYEGIVLDFGCMIPGFMGLLDQCNSIYSVTDPSITSRGQCQQFEASLMKNGMQQLAEKMTYVSFSIEEEQVLEQEPVVNQWLYGVIGDKARTARYGKHGKD